jgi:tetratricopeptide (TPR) repeat protein
VRHIMRSLGVTACALLLPVTGLVALMFSRQSLSGPDRARIPLMTGTGDYSRKVTTNSPLAQRYFDQGLAFLYGFNQQAARLSFEAAAEADPHCAMAYWGIAAAFGPDINNREVPPPALIAANAAIVRARGLSKEASPIEAEMIEALATHYGDPDREDRWPHDEAYAAAMGALAEKHPRDPDLWALRAEALMVIIAKADAEENEKRVPPPRDKVIEALKAALKLSPDHPLALHLWIHAFDSTPNPERASEAADRLRNLVPGIGHLLHMPSHIDVRLGHWQEAMLTNERAIAADHAYRRSESRVGSQLAYMSHSHHMLAFVAMMQGQSKKATLAVEEMLSRIPESHLADPGSIDVFAGLAYEVPMRFGHWNTILAETEPRESLPFAQSMWHYARAVALSAKGRTEDAKTEREKFSAARSRVPQDLRFRRSFVAPLLGIAEKVADGEILYREHTIAEGISALREAVRREDELNYVEPPLWMLPTRHALGAALINAQRYAEAESVYRKDLLQYPENGWSLYGLARSLEMQGKTAEAATVKFRFDKAWQYADVEVDSSCCCLPGRAAKGPAR